MDIYIYIYIYIHMNISSFCLWGLPFGGIRFGDFDFFEQLFLPAGSPLRGNPFSGCLLFE